MTTLSRCVASILLVTASSVSAHVKLPTLFADHMVLQRGIDAPIWGTGHPNDKITIEIAGKTATATADAHGNWMTRLPALDVADPTTMTITDSSGDKTSL